MGAPFVRIHHYCAGLSYLGRYHTNTDQRQQEYWLRRATGEMTYTFSRISPAAAIYPEIAKKFMAYASNAEGRAIFRKYGLYHGD